MNSVEFNRSIHPASAPKRKWKTAVIILPCVLLLCSTVMAKQAGMEKISKDISMFSKVLMEVLTEQQNVKFIRHFASFNGRNSEGVYLRGQGIFYEVDIRQGRHLLADKLDFDDSNMEIILEEGEVALQGTEMLHTLENVNWNGVVDMVHEGMDVYHDIHGEHASLDRQAIREKRQKMQEVREKLDSLRSNQESKRAELEAVRKELESARSELKKSHRQLREKRTKAKKQEIKAGNKKAQQLEKKIITAVCDYGSLLKSLPADEKLNIVLRDYYRDEQGVYRDKVYIFHKDEIKACMNEKLTAEKLQEKAISYLY